MVWYYWIPGLFQHITFLNIALFQTVDKEQIP